MSRHASRFLSLLRTGVLVLVALSLLAQPVVAAVSQIHGVGHPEIASAAQAAHEHEDWQAGAPHDEDEPSGHTDGSHGLMHQTCGGAFDRGVVRLELPSPVGSEIRVPAPDDSVRITTRLTSPFRPPIA